MAAIPATERRKMTLEEFRALPEGPPYYEFDDGELIPMTSPNLEHQDCVAVLDHALRQFARAHQLGRICMEVDVYLPDGYVYIPDLTFLATEHLSMIDPRDKKIHGVPDLVVEVLSSIPQRDRVRKFEVYYRNGVPWYWIVDSQTLAIEEYQHTPEGYLRTASVEAGQEFRPRLFPGLTIHLADLLGVTPPPPEDASETGTETAG